MPSNTHATSLSPLRPSTSTSTFVSSLDSSASPPTEQGYSNNVTQYLYLVMTDDHKLSSPQFYRSSNSRRPNHTPLRHLSNTTPTHTRSLTTSTILTDSSASSSDSDMATMTASPGSPPELSSSRSSAKSSSLRSSSIPGEDGEDMAHYEDISLSDPRRLASSQSPLYRPNKPRQLLRTTTAPITTQQHSRKLPPSPSNPRSASNGLRTTVTVNNGMRNLNGQRSPVKPNGFQPSAPTLAIPHKTSRRRKSPEQLHPRRPLPPPHRSATSPVMPQVQSDVGPFLPLKRSPSSTFHRKSAKELEAEFDELNSADEDMLDDAMLTNVPISPRPPQSRSPSVSPDRSIASPQSTGEAEFGRARSWDTALSGLNAEVRDLTLKIEELETRTRRNSDEGSYSTPASATPRPALHPSRSTTFELPPVQRPNPLVDPLPVSKEKEKHLTRTRPAWLPPKSKSEEKKHLKEYKRMMDAFAEAEKRRSGDSDKMKSNRSSKEKDTDESLRAWRSILGDWNNAVNTPETRERWWSGIPPALRGQVWARAIDNDLHLSAASYKAALGRAKSMAERLAQAPAPPSKNSHTRNVSVSETTADVRARRSLAAMEKDIATGAFPQLNLFQKGQVRHENLRDLLLAYAAYREDTGHVRGTAGIAALLLIQHMPVSPASSNGETVEASNRDSASSTKEEREREVNEAATAGAFIALANLLNRPISLAFCINDAGSKERTIRHVEKALKVKCPRLHEHFSSLMSRHRSNPDNQSPPRKENAPPAEVTPILRDIVNPLAQSLMTSVLTVWEAERLFDVLVFEGDGVVVRAIVGVLGRCEASLYGSQEEINKVLGWQSTGAPASKGAEDWIKWVKWAGREDAAAPR